MNGPGGAGGPGEGQAPSEEEIRAALEAELRQLRVDDLLGQTVVSLLNLGARRAGLAGAGDDEVDLTQVAAAIEASQALLGVLEKGELGAEVRPLRDALAQLQLAYARRSSQSPAGAAPAGEQGASDEPAKPAEQVKTGSGQSQPAAGEDESSEGPGPAESSGRLWVPGR